MAINADLLAPGSSVFYLRGTTGERVPATVAGLSSFPECVAISPVMTQVMRLVPRAPTIFAKTTHRCPYISPSLYEHQQFLHMTEDIWLTAPILSLPCFMLILVTVFCGVCVALLPEKVVQ